jgi:hypothetical protein
VSRLRSRPGAARAASSSSSSSSSTSSSSTSGSSSSSSGGGGSSRQQRQQQPTCCEEAVALAPVDLGAHLRRVQQVAAQPRQDGGVGGGAQAVELGALHGRGVAPRKGLAEGVGRVGRAAALGRVGRLRELLGWLALVGGAGRAGRLLLLLLRRLLRALQRCLLLQHRAHLGALLRQQVHRQVGLVPARKAGPGARGEAGGRGSAALRAACRAAWRPGPRELPGARHPTTSHSASRCAAAPPAQRQRPAPPRSSRRLESARART